MPSALLIFRFFNARGASPRTLDTYDATHRQYITFLAGQHIDDDIRHFTPDTVEAFAAYLQDRGLKATSISTALAALASLGDFGVKTKDAKGRYYLAENPLTRVYRPKRQRPREKYLSREELRSLIAVEAPAVERLAVSMLIDTALRASELVNANVADLRLDGDRLILAVKVKGRRHQEVTVGAQVGGVLLESLKLREAAPGAPLLVTTRGARYTRTSLSEMVSKLAKRAGVVRIAVRAHVLRHSVATMRALRGPTCRSSRPCSTTRTSTQSRATFTGRTPWMPPGRRSGRSSERKGHAGTTHDAKPNDPHRNPASRQRSRSRSPQAWLGSSATLRKSWNRVLILRFMSRVK